MDDRDSSGGEIPVWTGLARTKKGALARFWDNIAAGNIEGDETDAAGPSTGKRTRPSGPDLQSQQPTKQPPLSNLPILTRQPQPYSRRVMPRRETTPTTPNPVPQPAQPTDYIPEMTNSCDWTRVMPTPSHQRDPRPGSSHPITVPLEDEAFIRISELLNSGSQYIGSQPDGGEEIRLDSVSPIARHQTVSPTNSIPSVDLPSPISQPYPGVAPAVEHVRGNSSARPTSGVTEEQNRVCIEPVGGEHFRPAKHGIDIGLHCISKHWVPGWTTIGRCEQWAKDLWFEEFQARARWHEDHTATIKEIFFKKCRSKLNNGWYNLRHARTAEGLRFLKRHEVQAGLMWYYQNAAYIKKMSDRNKINSQGTDGRCVHMGGAKAAYIHFEELVAKSLDIIYCSDMYDRLKKKPDGTYVAKDGAEKALQLKAAHDALKEDGRPISQALDFDVGSTILGVSKRRQLPNVIGTAAAVVEGSKFHGIGSRSTQSSHSESSPKLDLLIQQVTQLQQQQQQQLQMISQLTQAYVRATGSQPIPREVDEDMPPAD